jgi:hypothetical protein
LAPPAGTAAELPASPARAAATPESNAMREILVEPCGSCHRSTLPTAKHGALAVFDLDEAIWDRKLSAEQIDSLAHRARALESNDPANKVILENYLTARRPALPDPGPN